jgi:hypothetical protein
MEILIQRYTITKEPASNLAKQGAKAVLML